MRTNKNYIPKLFIKTTQGVSLQDQGNEIDQLEKEMEKLSITPRTFDSRTYDDSFMITGGNFQDQWKWGFINQYCYIDNEIIHYSFNPDEINEGLITTPKIVANNLSSRSSTKSSNYNPREAEKIDLHELEISLINKAIDHLISSKNKVVLVDIFARENGGSQNGAIKLDDTNKIENHTIVLYKNPSFMNKQEIVVIDPSNFFFSSHLSNLNKDPNLSLKNIEVKTLHSALKIYKPEASDRVGPEVDKYRDCTDIAVKIGLRLNKLDDSTKIDLTKIRGNNIIQQISNNTTINPSIPEQIENQKDKCSKIPLRLQQKSNPKVGEDLYVYLSKINDNLDLISDSQNLQNKYIGILNGADKMTYIDALAEIYNMCELTYNELLQDFEKQRIDVLGKGFDNTMYEEII